MGEKLKQVPWLSFLWPTLMAVIFYAYTMNVRATIREELRGYLTVSQFETFKQNHKDYTDAVIDRMDTERDIEAKRLARIEEKLDQLLLRK